MGTCTSILSKYKRSDDGLRILGIYFGKCAKEAWNGLLIKMKSKLEFYKQKSNATSLLAKSRILNTFILPVLWYTLKVLDPPEVFLTEVETICENYLWEGRRHWIKKQMVYAPISNGGLGVKSPRVQIAIFRLREMEKALNPLTGKYFSQKSNSEAKSIILENMHTIDTHYESIRKLILKIGLTLNSMPSEMTNQISINNEVIFGSKKFEVLLTLGLSNVGYVEKFLTADTVPVLREHRIRKLNSEVKSYKYKWQIFLDNLELNGEGIPVQHTTFRAFNPLTSENEKLTTENDYLLCFFGIFPISSFSSANVQKLKSKKWERLKETKLSTMEIDVIWRMWNSSLITFKIASLMGLISSSICIYCKLANPNCHHLVFCTSAKAMWDCVWTIAEKMGLENRKREHIFGYDSSPLLNSLTFLAVVVSYRRFLYNVNSGKTDYDLVKTYKQLLYEKIYIEYIIAKSNNTLISFSESWGGGKGIFQYNAEKIDIRL